MMQRVARVKPFVAIRPRHRLPSWQHPGARMTTAKSDPPRVKGPGLAGHGQVGVSTTPTTTPAYAPTPASTSWHATAPTAPGPWRSSACPSASPTARATPSGCRPVPRPASRTPRSLVFVHGGAWRGTVAASLRIPGRGVRAGRGEPAPSSTSPPWTRPAATHHGAGRAGPGRSPGSTSTPASSAPTPSGSTSAATHPGRTWAAASSRPTGPLAACPPTSSRAPSSRAACKTSARPTLQRSEYLKPDRRVRGGAEPDPPPRYADHAADPELRKLRDARVPAPAGRLPPSGPGGRQTGHAPGRRRVQPLRDPGDAGQPVRPARAGCPSADGALPS